MAPVVGWGIVTIATATVVIVWFGLRHKAPAWLADITSAVGGAAVGVGGLLVVEDPDVWSWIVAPTLIAAATVVHRRLLFAGAGPLRT